MYRTKSFPIQILLISILLLSVGCSGNDGEALPTSAVVAIVPSATPTKTPLPTLYQTPTHTPTPTATPTLSVTLTSTPTPLPTRTRVPIPTITPQPSRTPVPTATPIPTATSLPPGGSVGGGGSSGGSSGGGSGSSGGSNGTWWAQYFNNRDLAGTPALSRSETAINDDWGAGAPVIGVSADNFSVKWETTINVSAGIHRFSVIADDGVRVYLDGQRIMDEWHAAGNTTYSVERNLSAGEHNLIVEYYEATGTANIQFTWEKSGDFPQWKGEYFNNNNLSGSPSLIRNDSTISFNWGKQAPISDLNVDNFSVRWTRTMAFEATDTYRFYAESDDGIRVYIDGQLVIDEWHAWQNKTYQADRSISQGNHTIRVEFQEQTGNAFVQFWWERGSSSAWTGDYFTNKNLSGEVALTREDANINFNWGSGSPATGIPADNFSVRWQRSVQFEAATYKFTFTFDDGIRVYLDNAVLFEEWTANSERTVTVQRAISSGAHLIRVEYFEETGNAKVAVSWENLSGNSGGGGSSNNDDWSVSFWNNINLQGDPAYSGTHDEINFDWGLNSPASNVNTSQYSARWESAIDFEDGTYQFNVTADDGVRIYVNGNKVLDRWRDDSSHRVFTVKVDLSGVNTIRVEYYNNQFFGRIHFWYEKQ